MSTGISTAHHTSRPRAFREALEGDDLLILPAAFNALTARIAEEVGFKAVFAAGQAIVNHLMSLPDYGYLSLTDMATVVRYMTRATRLPVFVDADTGYGTAVHVIRAVQELEGAGAAGMFIEDQDSPPRGGHIAGRGLISAEEMAGKIRAAVDARHDPDFVIGARTDARGVLGPDEAIRRGNLYAEAGADLTFLEGPLSLEEMERFAKEVDSRYKLVNMGGAGAQRTTPRPPLAEVRAMGYSVGIFAGNVARSAAKGVWDYLTDLHARGSAADLDFIASVKGYPFENWYSWTGYDEMREYEQRYLPPDVVARRYDQAQPGYYVPTAAGSGGDGRPKTKA
ncbi:MAG: isocitrate lyase/PEP mutase family protein [Candidatus Limnocylindria bacterium]